MEMDKHKPLAAALGIQASTSLFAAANWLKLRVEIPQY